MHESNSLEWLDDFHGLTELWPRLSTYWDVDWVLPSSIHASGLKAVDPSHGERRSAWVYAVILPVVLSL